MSEFHGMSIQERIRAMNKTIDKIDALPTSTTAAKTSNDVEQSTSQIEETLQEAPRRGRASVVDMWRNREASTEQQPQQPALRKKSVLQKWTTAQQKSVALEKVVDGSAGFADGTKSGPQQEEKQESDEPAPSQPKLSVAEIIAQKSVQKRSLPQIAANQSFKQSLTVQQAAKQPQPKMTVAELIVQRASTLAATNTTRSDLKETNVSGNSKDNESIQPLKESKSVAESSTSSQVLSADASASKQMSNSNPPPNPDTPVLQAASMQSNANQISKPAWAKRPYSASASAKGFSSPPHDKEASVADSNRPAWATTVLKRRELNGDSSIPATSSYISTSSHASPRLVEDSSEDSKPTQTLWGRKTLSSPPTAVVKPVSNFKQPSWVKKSVGNVTNETLTSPTLVVNENTPTATTKAIVPVMNESTPQTKTKSAFPRTSPHLLSKISSPQTGNTTSLAESHLSLAIPANRVPNPATSSGPSWAKKTPLSNPMTFSSTTANVTKTSLDPHPSWKSKVSKDTALPLTSDSESSARGKPSWAAVSLRKNAAMTSERVSRDGSLDHDNFAVTESPDIARSSTGSLTVNTSSEIAIDRAVSIVDKKSCTASPRRDTSNVENEPPADLEQKPTEPTQETLVNFSERSKEMLPGGKVFGHISDQPMALSAPDSPSKIIFTSQNDDINERSTTVGSSSSRVTGVTSELLVDTAIKTPQLSIVGPVSPPRSIGVRSPSATDFWNKLEKQSNVATSVSIGSAGEKKTQINESTRSAPVLIELAMRYKSRPINSSTNTQRISNKMAGKQKPVRGGEALLVRTPVVDTVSLGSGRASNCLAPSQARSARRRNRVAQKYLSNKAVLLTGSSDLESVNDAITELRQVPSFHRQSTHVEEAKIPRLDDDNGWNASKTVNVSQQRSSSQLTLADQMSPKSSKLSRPEEKKEIQKRRNRIKGRDDDRSVVSTESKSDVSQGSSYGTTMQTTDVLPFGGDKPSVPFLTRGMTPARTSSGLEPPESKYNVNFTNRVSVEVLVSNYKKDAEVSSDTKVKSNFEKVISRMATAKLADDDSVPESFISELSLEKGMGGAFLPYSSSLKASISEEPRYIPEALEPRKFSDSAGNRTRSKVDTDSPVIGERSDGAITDVWSFLTVDASTSNDNRSVISSTSGASSALVERATRVLQRRRAAKIKEIPRSSVQPQLEGSTAPVSPCVDLVCDDDTVAPFDEELPWNSHSQTGTDRSFKDLLLQSTHGKSTKKSKRSALDRSGFVNRYKSSERFIDSAGADLTTALIPSVPDPQHSELSCGSEISTASSAIAASSFDGSEPFITDRSLCMKSKSTAGPIGIDVNFQEESSMNMFAMKNAYQSVSTSDLANDLKEELAGTLSGSIEAMKNLASEFGKLAGAQNSGCEPTSSKKAYVRPSQQFSSALSDEEEVAIEVEYIGDDDESSVDEGDDILAKSSDTCDDFGAPAGQSSSEVYI